jgi:hypothetical protein
VFGGAEHSKGDIRGSGVAKANSWFPLVFERQQKAHVVNLNVGSHLLFYGLKLAIYRLVDHGPVDGHGANATASRRSPRYDLPMADLNRMAHRIVRESTEPKAPKSKAQINGHAGGVKGGVVRAEKLSAEKRSEIARKAAQARWSKTAPSA